MVKKLIATIGLPASGKSVWGASQVPPNGRGVIIVNKDDIRTAMTTMGWVWSRDNEGDVVRERDRQITEAFKHPDIHTVISTDTNFGDHLDNLRTLSMELAVEFEVKDFRDVPPWVCVKRNEGRVGDARIPEKVIWEMAERYLTPAQMVPTRRSPQLFVDLDGVLADFDTWVETNLGIYRNQVNEAPEFWDRMRGWDGEHLFYQFKPFPGAKEFWNALKPFDPIILTGTAYSVPHCTTDKRRWVRDFIDPDATIIHTRGKDKFKWGVPGDILIDDWTKYQQLWLGMGGKWITHTGDYESSLTQIKGLLT